LNQAQDIDQEMFVMEADHIIGDMLRRAHEHKLQTPLLRLAYCHLQAYEARQSKA
jgi:2-dehydropantoate 2-reductase